MSWASDEFPRIRARLMSAHMQPIERLAAEESSMVLALFREINEKFGTVKCEFRHREDTCSTEVTHRFACCTQSGNICENAANIDRARMTLPDARCSGCLAPLPDCWDLWPI